jgi:hypothetical protein
MNMTQSKPIKYNVGGVALDRPFKIRRLGHFGFNASDFEASKRFYFDLLGFFITEPAGAGYFGRHAGDHHSFALFDKKKFNERQFAGPNAKHFRPENDIPSSPTATASSFTTIRSRSVGTAGLARRSCVATSTRTIGRRCWNRYRTPTGEPFIGPWA